MMIALINRTFRLYQYLCNVIKWSNDKTVKLQNDEMIKR